MAHFLARLGSFCRVIVFDKRGTGLSDRGVSVPTLEERMDDVRAVMDAVGSERAAVFGVSEGGAMSMLFAATYPERTQALVLCGTYPHFFTYVLSPEAFEEFACARRDDVGHGGEFCGLRAVEGRGRGVPAMVGALRTARGEPVGGARPDAPQQRHRRTRCAADDPRPDARDAPGRRQARERRGRPLPRRQHPGRQVRRAARRGPLLPRRRRRPHRRRDGGLFDRLSAPISSPTASSRRSCSPTSSTRRSGP